MNTNDVEQVEVKEPGMYQGKSVYYKNVWLRPLTHTKRGGEEYRHNHVLRHFTMGPGGDIPMHEHKGVQIVYILSGKAVVRALSKDGKIEEAKVGAGDFVYNYSFEPHSFTNLSETEPVVFLCCFECCDDKRDCAPPA